MCCPHNNGMILIPKFQKKVGYAFTLVPITELSLQTTFFFINLKLLLKHVFYNTILTFFNRSFL